MRHTICGWDYPRAGGEKVDPTGNDWYTQGSPPRGRGKGVNVNCSADDIGITPAWAGKRSQVAAALQSGWDHPRVGGEKAELTAAVISAMGSPPRGRGKGFRRIPVVGFEGITPAQAGKSR